MAGSSALIDMQNITKVYQMGKTEVPALDGVSLSIEEGEYVAIVGTSGSGKSTLMNIIGLLDSPTEGVFQIRGHRANDLTGRQLADLRNREIGFVFQQFNLLARTPAWRQVELPLFYANVARGTAREQALEALAQVGLAERADHRPEELSGGQQQRVAIARALVNRPSLLLADEPTGALDTRTGEEVMALFEKLHREGLTLVIITHDQEVAERARRVIAMRDGVIFSDSDAAVAAVSGDQNGLNDAAPAPLPRPVAIEQNEEKMYEAV
ncbi:MAG: ABC transporter ATP-binding protein [Caldilineaceae bacterium]|nr:ABC transporter ATP-binding protein [Caldilineaceae bacterium]